jgi:hypothetical protein
MDELLQKMLTYKRNENLFRKAGRLEEAARWRGKHITALAELWFLHHEVEAWNAAIREASYA